MFNKKHRYNIFIAFLFLTVLTGMIVPARVHGRALISQPTARHIIQEAILGEPLGPGTYDDVDNHLSYSGNWEVQTGVTGVMNGTLHVSHTPGNKVEFQFNGNELRIFFQAGPSQGTIRLTLDNTSYIMNEASSSIQSYEWVLGTRPIGTHTVTLIHDSGGPVNFDAIIVPVPPTKIATILYVTSDMPDPSEIDQPVSVAVTLVDIMNTPVPNALVDITGADVNCQIITGNQGTGSCSILFSSVGSRVIIATYQGDYAYLPSSDIDDHELTLIDTTTSILYDGPDPSYPGEQLDVIVHVTGSRIPSGTVEIDGGQGVQCTITLSGGVGRCPLSYNTAGMKTLTATYSYSPDNPIFYISSDTEMHTVLNAPPTPKPPTFADVPASHPYYQDIETLYANGLTGGCSTDPMKYCPDQTMNRGQAAAFMLRARFGTGYVPNPPVHIFNDDWSKGPWAEAWAEGMKNNGYSAGCLALPLKYCPWSQIPREQAVIFILKLKYGKDYTPPPATGTLFADMTNPSFYATAWAEEAYKEGLIPGCESSGGKPKFCPKELVSRGLAAYMIVRARN